MAYKVIILYRLYMPPYFLGTFTEYPCTNKNRGCFRSETASVILSAPISPVQEQSVYILFHGY